MEQEITQSEISIKKVILELNAWYKFLLSRWKTIVAGGLVFSSLGLLYTFLKAPSYLAEYTFVLEEEGQGGLGQYSALASMLGMDVGGGGGSGGLFKGDNIIDLYQSNLMIGKTLLSSADSSKRSDLLINRYISINGLRKKWKDEEALKGIRFTYPHINYSRKQDSIFGTIIDDIHFNYLTIGRKADRNNIISVKVKSPEELFSKQFADNLVQNVNTFYLEARTKKSRSNLEILRQKRDSLKRVLYSSMGGAVASIDANPNANSVLQSLKLPSQKRQVDITTSGAIYAEIVKNIELSEITLRKESPLIQIIDSPMVPLFKDTKGKVKYMLAGFIFGMAMTGFVLLFRKLIAEILS